MKDRSKESIFLILGLAILILMVVIQLVISINAVNQRREIVCILKITPSDRQLYPERVEACR